MAPLFSWQLLATDSLTQSSPPVQFDAAEIKSIEAHGPWPLSMPFDSGNALSDQAWAEQLGELLFFDNRLSRESKVSCASCHVPQFGFADNLPVAIGAERGVRNTQGLLDVGLQRWFGWDGGADSLWAASMRPMLAEHEMAGSIPQLAAVLKQNNAFVQAIKENHIPIEQDKGQLSDYSDAELVVIAAKSIASYTRTLQSGSTPFDLFRKALNEGDKLAQNDYPESAKRGLKLFLGEANCRACHFGANFSNGEFHDTGRPFFTAVGQVDPGRYTGIQRVRSDPYNLLGEFGGLASQADKNKTATVKLSQANWGQWRTPPLRNLKLTAPYMHDGSLATLRDVVDAYADIDPDRLHAAGESLLKPLNLTEQDRDDLVAFLLSLSVSDE